MSIPKSASAEFPFLTDNENNCLKRAETVEDMLLSAIRLYIITRRGSRVGNIVGCFLPELLLQLVPLKTLPSFSEQLKQDLIQQFPGVDFIAVDLQRDLSQGTVDLIVKISFSAGNQDNIIGLEIRLPSRFQANQIQRENI